MPRLRNPMSPSLPQTVSVCLSSIEHGVISIILENVMASHRSDIKRLSEQLLSQNISEDFFWYNLVRFGIQGGYQTSYMVAQALSLGLGPEGGDGA